MKIKYPTVFILLLLNSILWSAETSLVRIPVAEHSKMLEIQNTGAEIVFYSPTEKFAEVILSPEQKSVINKSGFYVQPVIENIGAFVEQLRNDNYFQPFHNYDEMLSEMQLIVQNNPTLASLHDIGDSYNKAENDSGYDIWALKISDDVINDDSTEADILIMANIHAREIITPEIVMYYMHYLIDNYNKNPYATHLVNNREIWLIPTVNPDGHEHVFTGDISAVSRGETSDPVWWRKNKRDNNSNGRFDSGNDGVDLNRNFGYFWGYNNSGSSPNFRDATYRGTGPFSEPESQAIQDFVLSKNFVTSFSFHSYGRLLLYPWCYDDVPLTEPEGSAFRAIADSCVAYNGYFAGNYSNGAIYQTNGDSDDWFFGKAGIYAFTPEVGSIPQGRFWPDTSLIEPLILENMGPCLYISEVAGEEPIISYKNIPDYDEPQEKYNLNIEITQPLLLTQPVNLDRNSFRLFYKSDVDSNYQSLPLNSIGFPNSYTVDIPGDSLALKYFYYVEAQDKAGRKSTKPKAAPVFADSFLIKIDSEFPLLTHGPIGYIHPDFLSNPLFVQATDNLGIQSVFLEYVINDQIEKQIFLAPAKNDTFFVSLDSLGLQPGDRFKYRIGAEDASQNSNISYIPEDGWFEAGVLVSITKWDFEEEQIFTTNIGSDWQWGIPQSGPDSAFSGKKVWGTILNGDYSPSSNSQLHTPQIYLNDNNQQPVLFFWHWYQTEFSSGSIWDGGNIKISVDNGPFQIITPTQKYDGTIDVYNNVTGGEPGFGGPNGIPPLWRPVYINLNDYIDKTVQFEFHFGSDDNTNFAGWYIDDVELLAIPKTISTVPSPFVKSVSEYILSQNYPNPFNSETFINFRLKQKSNVTLTIFNSLGQPIKTLVKGERAAGQYQTKWDGTDEFNRQIVSGIYFYKLKTANQVYCRKLLLIR